MKVETVCLEQGDIKIEASLHILGDDLLVILHGGVEHIGAVGMAQPRPSLKDPRVTSSTGSVFTYTGHKEDDIAKKMSEYISKALCKKVVVVAGLHWDNIDEEGLIKVEELCAVLSKEIIRRMMKG